MKNQKTKSILIILCFIILSVFAGFIILQGLGKQHKGTASHIKLGLDLAGGVSITYQVKEDNPTDTESNDCKRNHSYKYFGKCPEIGERHCNNNRVGLKYTLSGCKDHYGSDK